jgi:hypothetical protein
MVHDTAAKGDREPGSQSHGFFLSLFKKTSFTTQYGIGIVFLSLGTGVP